MKIKMICKFWHEEDIEICKLNSRQCVCGADIGLCDYRYLYVKKMSEGKVCRKCHKDLRFLLRCISKYTGLLYAYCECGNVYTKYLD